MIKITFCGKDGKIFGFDICGHSGYAEAGSDIVCAAVSSCALMVANTATEILSLPADVKDADGMLHFRLKAADAAAAQPLLEGFRLHVDALAKQYPQNIQCQTKMYSITIRRCNNNAET